MAGVLRLSYDPTMIIRIAIMVMSGALMIAVTVTAIVVGVILGRSGSTS